jgi:hypothetical protein
MSRHPVIVPARYTQGLSAYRAGLSIKEIISTFEEIEQMHEQPDLSNEQHEEIANAGPSLIAGFADGLIDDIRKLASSTNITRRGASA